jgi:hypothetical protein
MVTQKKRNCPMADASSIEKVKVLVLPSGKVSRKSAAIALGRTEKTLSDWALKGIGPTPHNIMGRIFYDWDEVQECMGVKAA